MTNVIFHGKTKPCLVANDNNPWYKTYCGNWHKGQITPLTPYLKVCTPCLRAKAKAANKKYYTTPILTKFPLNTQRRFGINRHTIYLLHKTYGKNNP